MGVRHRIILVDRVQEIRVKHMNTSARSKVALVLLSIALLLVNPAGICAGNAMAQSPSHPCCPKAPTPHQDSSDKSNCVCIDRQPAPPTLPPVTAEGQFLTAPPVSAGIAPELTPVAVDPTGLALFYPHDRCLQFHQLLL